MNRGALATRAAIEAEGLSQNAAAAEVGCDSGNFSKILAGKKLPGRDLTLRIAKRFKVSGELWTMAAHKGAA
jgi:plasmid maintenance system antidote protein VapI